MQPWVDHAGRRKWITRRPPPKSQAPPQLKRYRAGFSRRPMRRCACARSALRIWGRWLCQSDSSPGQYGGADGDGVPSRKRSRTRRAQTGRGRSWPKRGGRGETDDDRSNRRDRVKERPRAGWHPLRRTPGVSAETPCRCPYSDLDGSTSAGATMAASVTAHAFVTNLYGAASRASSMRLAFL